MRNRSLMRTLASIVLTFEAIVVGLGSLVVFGLRRLDAPLALGGGAALVIVMLLTVALLRYRWAYAVGWAIQVLVLATGLIEPGFYVVGIIFGAMWVYCIVAGARLDRTAIPDPEGTIDHDEH